MPLTELSVLTLFLECLQVNGTVRREGWILNGQFLFKPQKYKITYIYNTVVTIFETKDIIQVPVYVSYS